MNSHIDKICMADIKAFVIPSVVDDAKLVPLGRNLKTAFIDEFDDEGIF